MKNKQKAATLYAIAAAALYANSSPLSKLLLQSVPPTMMAALLYLGAGIGLAAVGGLQRRTGAQKRELPLAKRDMPFVVGMVLLDIAAPILLMIGLTMTSPANVSLLNNFEIVATSVIALCVFQEAISKRLWLAIGLVTLASLLLCVQDLRSFSLSLGSVFVLLASVCWGFENNCTRKISGKNPQQIVVIKGIGSGLGSLAIALSIGERLPAIAALLCALALGFVAYGLSILLYIYAQRELGAAKTSAYYAVSPFIGAALSLLIFAQQPSLSFVIALAIMIAGAYFASTDSPRPCEGAACSLPEAAPDGGS